MGRTGNRRRPRLPSEPARSPAGTIRSQPSGTSCSATEPYRSNSFRCSTVPSELRATRVITVPGVTARATKAPVVRSTTSSCVPSSHSQRTAATTGAANPGIATTRASRRSSSSPSRPVVTSVHKTPHSHPSWFRGGPSPTPVLQPSPTTAEANRLHPATSPGRPAANGWLPQQTTLRIDCSRR